jgi:Na+-translocating ferredoxin:NAD+ oxidoreductase RnfE subunit
MTCLPDDSTARLSLGTLALLPLLAACDSAVRGLALGLTLLATLLVCAMVAAVIGARLPPMLRGIAFAAIAATAAAAMQLALRAVAPPPVDGHDALLALLAANGALGWLAVSRGGAGVSVASLRGAITLGLGGTLALVAIGGLRGLAGGLLASPIGGFALLALLIAGWQAWQQRRADATVAER